MYVAALFFLPREEDYDSEHVVYTLIESQMSITASSVHSVQYTIYRGGSVSSHVVVVAEIEMGDDDATTCCKYEAPPTNLSSWSKYDKKLKEHA